MCLFILGCAPYAFNTLIGVFGNGHLLPKPEYPAKVQDKEPLPDNKIRMAIYDANLPGLPYQFRYTILHIFGALTIAVQLIIASIPTTLTAGEEWEILVVAAIGTTLTLLTGILPQWKAGGLPNGQRSDETYALTAGNGSRDIFIIQGKDHCIGLDESVAHESPIFGTPWLKSRTVPAKDGDSSATTLTQEIWGMPKGFFITVCSALVLATWAMMLVGGIWLLYNTIVAGIRRNPSERSLPPMFVESILARNILDGLMDLEVSYPGSGDPLICELSPGDMSVEEREWWQVSGKEKAPLAAINADRSDRVTRFSQPAILTGRGAANPRGFKTSLIGSVEAKSADEVTYPIIRTGAAKSKQSR
ncbi:hypothetical protein PG984_010096 [Apiospora sp. TS-2023a]